jgi:hypothetical protein
MIVMCEPAEQPFPPAELAVCFGIMPAMGLRVPVADDPVLELIMTA